MISHKKKENTQRIILYIAVVVIGSLFIFPFYWMVISSFKYNRDVLPLPVRFVPPEWNWYAYRNVFTEFPDFDFPLYILNSFIVALFAVLLCLFFSATSGYGFAKYRFKGNNLLFTSVLATI